MPKYTVLQIRNAAKQDFGGGERYPIFLSLELSSLGIENIVFSRSNKLLGFAQKNNVPVQKSWWWQNQNWSGKNALLFPVYLGWQIVLFFYYLFNIIKLNPKVVHIQSKDDFIAATFAGKLLGKKIIWTDHADLKHVFKNVSKWYKNPTGHFVYFASRFADKIILVSNGELSEINKQLPEQSHFNKKATVIHNGVSDQKNLFKNEKNKMFTFLIASRLVKDKGIGEAIAAFIELNKKHQDTLLIILGDGPDEGIFKKMSKDNKNIVFLGHQSAPLEKMSNCDVFLLPTYHEGFSVALVEASMLGLPVIATAVGGNIEIITNNDNGLLVPVKDPVKLQKAMEKLYQDRNLAKKLSENNRKKYLDNYIISNIVKNNILPLYNIKKDK